MATHLPPRLQAVEGRDQIREPEPRRFREFVEGHLVVLKHNKDAALLFVVGSAAFLKVAPGVIHDPILAD